MSNIQCAVDPEIGYFLIIVFGLPLLLLLLTGPGMWSEKWGWRTLERLERLWRRMVGRKQQETVSRASERSPRPPR